MECQSDVYPLGPCSLQEFLQEDIETRDWDQTRHAPTLVKKEKCSTLNKQQCDCCKHVVIIRHDCFMCGIKLPSVDILYWSGTFNQTANSYKKSYVSEGTGQMQRLFNG